MSKPKNKITFNLIVIYIKNHPHIWIFVTAVIVTISILALIISAILSIVSYSPTITAYTDVADYGRFHGTSNDEFVSKYIKSFFPNKIDNSFSNVNYSYTAISGATYSFEAYLEFTIEDSDVFNQFITSIADEDQWRKFQFDSDFMEYSIEDGFWIDENEEKPTRDYRIIMAKIRKVLYSPDTQTIVFVALGVYDGSTNINYLNTFFERFDIDPAAYAKTAPVKNGTDPYGI